MKKIKLTIEFDLEDIVDISESFQIGMNENDAEIFLDTYEKDIQAQLEIEAEDIIAHYLDKAPSAKRNRLWHMDDRINWRQAWLPFLTSIINMHDCDELYKLIQELQYDLLVVTSELEDLRYKIKKSEESHFDIYETIDGVRQMFLSRR